MSIKIKELQAWWQSADSSVQIHRWLKWLWILLAIPILLFFQTSVPVLVFISVYANIVGHWSSEQAGKVEKKQEEADNKKD